MKSRKKREENTVLRVIRRFEVKYQDKDCHFVVSRTKITIGLISPNNKRKGQVLKIININEISGLHPLSTVLARRESDGYGVLICIVELEEASFETYRIVTANKKDEYSLTCLLQSLAFGLPSHHGPPLNRNDRSLLILINPVAGEGNSVKFFDETIRIVLDLAHLRYTTIITQRFQHAVDIARNLDLSKYTEVGVVGGDGTLNEVVRGLTEHPKLHYREIKSIPISLFPTGKSNSFASEIGIDPLWVGTASLACARGKYVHSDACTLFLNGRREISLSSLSHGFFPNIKFGYSNWKFLGGRRYLVGVTHSLLAHSCVQIELEIVVDRIQESDPYEPESNEERTKKLEFKSTYIKKEESVYNDSIIRSTIEEDAMQFPSSFRSNDDSSIIRTENKKTLGRIREEEKNTLKTVLMPNNNNNNQAPAPPSIGRAGRNVMKDCPLLRKHFPDVLSRLAAGYGEKMVEDRQYDNLELLNQKIDEEEEEAGELGEDDDDDDDEINESEEEGEEEFVEELEQNNTSSIRSSLKSFSISSEDRSSVSIAEEEINLIEEEEDEGEESTVVENLTGSFFVFTIKNIRRISYEIPVAVNQRLNNGYLDLCMIRKSKGRLAAIREIFQMMTGNLKPVDTKSYRKNKKKSSSSSSSSGLEMRRFKAFRFRPLCDDSFLDIDGEKRENSQVLGEIHNNFFSVIHL